VGDRITHLVEGLSSGEAYYYSVKASTSAGGLGPRSNTARAKTPR